MGDKIGNCRIINEIGSGGMAVVHRAVQEPLGRHVAIKSLKPSIAMDSGFAKRFEREAHFMASLQHENILHVYDFVKERGTMHIIMEYVQGIDLYDLLNLAPKLPIDIATIIALQIARALNYAHFRGVIHRDIKPANIMLSKEGEVKLMDFGIARDDRLTDLTETGTGLGTPSYMSPEQILGDKLDFRSDVFSLGIVLYQMLTGKKPFVEDEGRTVMQKIRLDRFVNPRKLNPQIPRSLERILSRCMEKMRANRYSSTQALMDDLADFLSSRVNINHNARMVLFLREVGVLTEGQAEEILSASSLNRGRRRATYRHLLPSMWAANLLLFSSIVASGIVIQASHTTADGDESQYAAERGMTVVPENAGYLQFVVEPWAEVHIDGQHVLTTPSARRIALAPGRHWIDFRNPYYPNRTQELWVNENETTRLTINLEESSAETPPDAGLLPVDGQGIEP